MPRFRTAVSIAVATGAVAIGQGADATPSFIKGEVTCSFYDGIRDDLLTGGLGKSGLEASAPPLISVPPTASELRRLAIYNNYRALVPTDPGGGYGTLFGPNVLADGTVTGGEGLVAGTECLAFAGSASGRENVTLMIQVPTTFEPAEACNLRYYEVKNAHHLDALTILDVTSGVDLFADKFVPLHHYFFQALDIMLDHLRNGTPLPPSQVVRTMPRGPRPDPSSAPPPLTLANVPPINPDPPAADRIVFEGDVLSIPE